MTTSKSRQHRLRTTGRKARVQVRRMTPVELRQLKARVRYMKANLPYITDKTIRASHVEEIKRLETVIQNTSMY